MKKVLRVTSVALVAPEETKYERAREIREAMAQAFAKGGVAVKNGIPSEPVDLAIAIGGDGTVMHTATAFSLIGVPTLGVNAGDVGFLTSAEGDAWPEVVRRVLSSQFIVEERMALSAEVHGEVFDLITNEVLVRHPYSLVHVEVSLGSSVIHQALPADGVLLATATGSTAYNASVHGPIISPSSTSVVLNAISPSVLNFRPFVMDEISQGETLRLRVVKSKHQQPVAVLGDGQPLGKGLVEGESVLIRKSSKPLLFATFDLDQYLEALKSKKGFAR